MSTSAPDQPVTRRNTRQRQLVLDAVRSRCDHPAVCRCCGAVADVMLPYDDGLDERAGLETGFSVDAHNLVFEGTCPACQHTPGA